ncbi:MlaD family protein [Gordonia hydrophobica]|uniref:MlaD family protein n=1 Tax=Gordonia hydrophobica TaxID=40516 RepID=A0ABZ2U382_9ACTN|nr:MlaD family protein [Gordonia hydrophobica]MBM7367365.1 virulence factor Mce-like protein [Gordonia hydrophobica]
MKTRFLWILAVLVPVMLVMSGCSLSPNRLPSVKAGVSADYEVTLKFASVLNLPTGADVMMNGLQVGRVKELNESKDGVDVVVGLTASRPVPADSTAIIRQNTPLGDTYLGFTPPENPTNAGNLHDGSVVPMSRTTSPPTLEDTIAVLAYFVNGGTVQKVQDTMVTLNKTLPQIKDVRRLASTVATDLDDLAGNLGEIDRLLTGLDGVAKSFPASRVQIEHVFGDQGIDYYKTVGYSLVRHIATLLPSVGSVFTGGLWVVPLLTSIAEAAENAAPIWPAGDRMVAGANDFVSNTLKPFLKNPRVAITSVKAKGSDKQMLADSASILRILGVVR